MSTGPASKKRAFAHFSHLVRTLTGNGVRTLTHFGPVNCLRTQWNGILAARFVAGAVTSFVRNPLRHFESQSALCPELRMSANARCGEDFGPSDRSLHPLF